MDTSRQALLISDLRGSAQEGDLSEPVNCGGYGRVRHFGARTSPGWPENPLPATPAAAALGLAASPLIRAQVFQNAICNWRCWYCFVPFTLLSGNPAHSKWFTVSELVDAYLALPDRPPVLVLSGGQPDLVPEWVPWTLQALDERGASHAYVWSDDNLSTEGCFKGFDAESFEFNTRAAPELFARQFDLFGRLLATGMDLYAYATLTASSADRVSEKVARFVDRLQQIAEPLPLHTMPLEIEAWNPVTPRIGAAQGLALRVQAEAVAAWNAEIAARFTDGERRRPVTEIRLRPQGR